MDESRSSARESGQKVAAAAEAATTDLHPEKVAAAEAATTDLHLEKVAAAAATSQKNSVAAMTNPPGWSGGGGLGVACGVSRGRGDCHTGEGGRGCCWCCLCCVE